MAGKTVRKRFTYRGIIQGVGFRPTIYRAAVSLDLTGYVQNRRSVVVAEIEGTEEQVEAYPEALAAILPEAAEIVSVSQEEIDPESDTSFKIVESRSSDYTFPPIPPDLAICSDCRKELFNRQNRRYLYPFITCTQCGPRFSIVEDTPFDRETTSMIDFPQCPACMKEYTDPMDRRFHSQTNSCEVCGPELTLKKADGGVVDGDPLLNTIGALKNGSLVAIEGVGGFHLAVFPGFEETVEKLRSDKERERKPFALMVRDVEEARNLCFMTVDEEKILTGTESPILILPEKPAIPDYLKRVSDTGTLGIMTPYTPLHLLLFNHPGAEVPYRHLVMTSANWRGEPILTEPDAVFNRLGDIVDYVLFHNRRIVFRNDDSVLRSLDNDTTFLRRSRGYVPRIISLSAGIEKVTLAAGGDLKSAPAFAKGNDIYLSPYLGDLENQATYEAFEEQVRKILSLYTVEPERVVYDLHPGYYSTTWAEKLEIPEKLTVQHHHAHILSVMAEHNLEESLGIAFDGTGFGTDGTIWGGEFLLARRDSFQRLGRFSPFPIPGGDQAVFHPIRIAYAILKSRGNRDEQIISRLGHLEEADLLSGMIEKNINSPLTSSMGRVFDAAAAVLGIVEEVSYEGEGPIRMEGLALKGRTGALSPPDLFPFVRTPEGEELLFEIEPAPIIEYLAKQKQTASAGDLSLLFHRAAAEAAFKGASLMREATGIDTISLSGGVFQNMLLRSLLVPALKEKGFQVHLNRNIPPGDGGIAVGQVYAV